MTHTVTLGPEEVYDRLSESAKINNKPVKELVVQSIKAGMLPPVNHLPSGHREECLALERLSNKQLRQVAESTIPPARQRRYSSFYVRTKPVS